ncbi:UDP-N-acetyl glucosamine 2-epimerase [Chlorobaculum limnaeum]|uniref:UDP-N-acetyl glucosamine 2-epimerase n=1 Tax=Chlorobaculum limnaeum TaxID=274537 RepID=A0A1D8D4B5_CHLLM|nr:UDP-N-acetyl glucosamine 2-epimerase [Chlorobaculum limnaeum]AOS84735.1 UDP-N-acetyl glucosamine 2-epimerase [Chlorobaculum limnaeum]
MKKIVLIAQDRAAFLHVAPLVNVFRKNGVFEPVLVRVLSPGNRAEHDALAAAFGSPDELRIIETEPGSPVGETASYMLAFERIFNELAPDFVIPGGHDSASLAGALAAAKMGIPVASLDAGLRSYDRAEPEEINRLVIDSVAALHFVSEHSGIYNLMNEGFADERIIFVGNTAIDSLVTLMEQANESSVLESLSLTPKKFVTVLIEPKSSGNRDLFCKVLESLAASSTVLLPGSSASDEALGGVEGLRMIDMPGYIDMLRLLRESAFVLTDSAEFEAELTVMNVPCLTLRPTTARPSTVEIGTNVLVAPDEEEILKRASLILSGKQSEKTLIPEKWDGAAAKRVAEVLERGA